MKEKWISLNQLRKLWFDRDSILKDKDENFKGHKSSLSNIWDVEEVKILKARNLYYRKILIV